MREILFRGKDVRINEWRYGYFVVEKWTSKIVPNTGEKFTGERFTIVTATLGQYTGVDDLDGNNIFEGDIVRVSAKPDSTNNLTKGIFSHHGETAVVIMEKGRWVVKRQLSSGSYYYLIWLYGDGYDFTVIGNIHDNPELLGDRK